MGPPHRGAFSYGSSEHATVGPPRRGLVAKKRVNGYWAGSWTAAITESDSAAESDAARVETSRRHSNPGGGKNGGGSALLLHVADHHAADLDAAAGVHDVSRAHAVQAQGAVGLDLDVAGAHPVEVELASRLHNHVTHAHSIEGEMVVEVLVTVELSEFFPHFILHCKS